ncbi:MAG: hypothetical protein VKQ33_12450 [Candidatus Sericytochromatia bacterium]|nr:hypothetical protein [Candidatus Sericytochromatia bacterium]
MTPLPDASDGPTGAPRGIVGALVAEEDGRPLGHATDILADPVTGTPTGLTIAGPEGPEHTVTLAGGLRWDGRAWRLPRRAMAPAHAPTLPVDEPGDDWMRGLKAAAALHDRQGGLIVPRGGCIDAGVVIAATRAGVLHLLEAAPSES